MPSRRRLWIFRFTSVVVLPLLVLCGIEGLLRAVGYGDAASFTVPCEIGRRPASCDNPRFTRRFFPPEIARTAPSFSFSKIKEPRTYRIFVLGGSAAQGDPDPTFGFSRILALLLEERYPGFRFEVINTAITAINSHVVRSIADDLAGADGDLYLVYLGNNEVVGPYGPGTVFARASSSLAAIRASVFLRGTRLGQLMARTMAGGGGPDEPSEWRGMEFFLDRRIRTDDPRLSGVYNRFRRNLQAIVGAASGRPVLLCTVATNRNDSAPFASEHRDGLTETERRAWEEAFERGVEAQRQGRGEEALAAFVEAERTDASFADLQYRLGRLLLQRDEPMAGSRLIDARDLDTLRFRADSEINETIREIAQAHEDDGVYLVDAEQVLQPAGDLADAPGELFLDHVHLTFRGNYLLAEALASRLAGLLPEEIRSAETDRPYLSEEDCAARLAHSEFDRHRIASLMRERMGRPPFTGQSDHALKIDALENEIAAIEGALMSGGLERTFETYREAIRAAGSDPWLRFNHAAMLSTVGSFRPAADELRRFLDAFPHDVQGRERLAAALAEQGEFDAAVAECRITIEREPSLSTSYYTMAYALAQLGRLDESVATYRTLLDVDPGSWDRIYNEIGRMEIHRERFGAAIGAFEDAIRRSEREGGRTMPDLWFNYGVALKRDGRPDDALAAYRRAADQYGAELARDPSSATLHLARAGALSETGDLAGASRHYRHATELDPLNFAAHANLVRALRGRGLRDEAGEALLEGERVLREAGRVREAERLRRVGMAAEER